MQFRYTLYVNIFKVDESLCKSRGKSGSKSSPWSRHKSSSYKTHESGQLEIKFSVKGGHKHGWFSGLRYGTSVSRLSSLPEVSRVVYGSMYTPMLHHPVFYYDHHIYRPMRNTTDLSRRSALGGNYELKQPRFSNFTDVQSDTVISDQYSKKGNKITKTQSMTNVISLRLYSSGQDIDIS
jgi:hypothetical protein